MDKKEDSSVRLTKEAHGSLVEMALDCDRSRKDVASEAITRMANRTQEKKKFAFSAFFIGTIAGGAVMFIMGVLW